MAEAVDTIVEDTQQPRNCASLQERGAEDKCLGDTNSQAPRKKRASLDEEFPRNIRPHRRSVEGVGRWAEPRLPQPHPSHARWPPAAQWSQDDNEYDEDGYVVGARTQNWQHVPFNVPHWQDVTFNAPHWQADGLPSNSRRGRPWGGRASIPRSNVPRMRYPHDRGYIMDEVYIDRDGYQVQQPQQRNMYQEGEHHDYGKASIRYVDNQPVIGNAPPLLPPSASTLQAHLLASTGPMQAPANGKERQPPSTSNIVEDVYSFESFNPESSAMKSIPNAEDIAQPALSSTKGRRSVQLIYEKEEVDRIAQGQKPFRIECNSTGRPIESGRVGSRFLEALRALCIVFLDVSIIKVLDQNIKDYGRLREKVESEFEFIGHPLSDEGFKKAVSKCMKAERSRLHRLYTSRPDRECPPKEQQDVWDRLKTYWSSPEFGKVAKVRSAATQTATTSEDVPDVTTSMATRLKALEGKISECGPSRLDFAALISELAMLNSNVRALTDAMVSNLKHSQEIKQQESKVDVDKTPATDTRIGQTIHLPPPSTSEPEGAERGRYYMRVHSGRRGKEVVRAPSPPRLVLNTEGPMSNNVHSQSENVEAPPADEGAGGSTSPGTDCALISPPAKALKTATMSRKRPSSNARGKAQEPIFNRTRKVQNK